MRFSFHRIKGRRKLRLFRREVALKSSIYFD